MDAQVKKLNLVSFAILALCLILLLAWLFVYNKLNEKVIDYQNLKVKGNQLSDRGEEERGIAITLREASDRIKLLDSFFIKEGSDIIFIEQVENLAKIAGVLLEINSVSPDTGALRMSLKAEGTFSSLYHFLLMIEALPYQIQISDVEVLGGKEDGKWESLFNIKLLNYLPKK